MVIDGKGWERIDAKMKVVRLTVPVQLAIPVLLLSSMSKSTRGLSLYPGMVGVALGAVLATSSVLLGLLLAVPLGILGLAVALWLLGTAAVASIASAFGPIAFIKPICVECRLLPVIKEHEALHLAGKASERSVWEDMKARHSVRSLALEGDPSICSFCPIPKRLSE